MPGTYKQYGLIPDARPGRHGRLDIHHPFLLDPLVSYMYAA